MPPGVPGKSVAGLRNPRLTVLDVEVRLKYEAHQASDRKLVETVNKFGKVMIPLLSARVTEIADDERCSD
jgi:hypothetical protein